MFLDKQRAEKEPKGSPNRIKERLNSARKLSTQIESEQQPPGRDSSDIPHQSPNKSRRALRSSSSYGPKQQPTS